MTFRRLSADDVRALVSMAEAVDAVRTAFIDLADSAFETPARLVLGEGSFLVMPTHHRPTGSLMVKTLTVNFDRLPAIDGTVVLTDLQTLDQLVADAGAVTGLRTGAAAAVATDLLARPDASRFTMLGAGKQALDQVRGILTVRDITHVTIVDRDERRADAMAQEVQLEFPTIMVSVDPDADRAVASADIVSCATTSTQPLFRAESLPARVHINAIGAYLPTMRELDDAVLSSSYVVVDDIEAVLVESGEIIHAIVAGAIAASHLTALGAVLTSKPVGHSRSVFKSVGVAVQDWAIARLLSEKLLAAPDELLAHRKSEALTSRADAS